MLRRTYRSFPGLGLLSGRMLRFGRRPCTTNHFKTADGCFNQSINLIIWARRHPGDRVLPGCAFAAVLRTAIAPSRPLVQKTSVLLDDLKSELCYKATVSAAVLKIILV